MKKVWAVLLLLWPYLLIPFMLLAHVCFDKSDAEAGLLLYCILTPAVYIGNIVCACRTKNERSLAFWDMLLKLCHIPAYILVFMIGVMLTGQLIVGNPFGVILVPFLVVIDVFLLCTTSVYGAGALIRAKRSNTVSIPFLVTNLVLHFIFVLDVISAVIVFCKLRKQKTAP